MEELAVSFCRACAFTLHFPCNMSLRLAFSAVHLCRSQGHASPFAGSLLAYGAGVREFHLCIPVSADSKAVKKGKERQASAASQLAEILPQHPTPPERSAEELRDAEARVKEFSRRRMLELRAHQNMQKERRRLRCSLTRPAQSTCSTCSTKPLPNCIDSSRTICDRISGTPVT